MQVELENSVFKYTTSMSVDYNCTLDGVCWWITNSLHLQLHAFNLLPKCKQTISASRHVKSSFSSWDRAGLYNQSNSEAAKQNENGHQARNSEKMLWFRVSSSDPWWALWNGNFHPLSVGVGQSCSLVLLVSLTLILFSHLWYCFLFRSHDSKRAAEPLGRGWMTHTYLLVRWERISREGPLSGFPSQNNGIKCTHHKICTLGYMDPHTQHIPYAGQGQRTTVMDTQGTQGNKWTVFQWTTCGLINIGQF